MKAGAGETGAKRLDADADRTDVALERARKADNKRFSRGVIGGAVSGEEPGGRRDVDDKTGAALLVLRFHRNQRGASQPHRREAVRLNHRRFDVEKNVRKSLVPAETGVVDEVTKRRKGLQTAFDALDFVEFREVGDERFDRDAELGGQVGGDFVEEGAASSDEKKVATFGGQTSCVNFAETARSAGDRGDGAAVFSDGHFFSPLLRGWRRLFGRFGENLTAPRLPLYFALPFYFR